MTYQVCGWHEAHRYVENIDQRRYLEVKHAREVCLTAIDLEEKINLLLDNYSEFEIELLKLAQWAIVHRVRDHHESMLQRLLIDRRIVNLLTACRLYLDQSEHRISQLFGNSSEQLGELRGFKSKLYDSRAGYRIVEALRNYAQHAGLLVHQVQYSASAVGSLDPRAIQYTVIPSSIVKYLKQDKIIKSSIIEEIAKSGDNFDLRGPVREYVGSFADIHLKIRTAIEEKLRASRVIFEDAIKEFAVVGGKSVTHASFFHFEEGYEIEEIYLGQIFLDHLDELLEKNSFQSDILRRFASNMIKSA